MKDTFKTPSNHPSHPIPSNPNRKLAFRACRVNAKLDPERKGKDFVGKGLDTLLERLAWGQLVGSKRPVAAYANHTPTPQLDIKF